MDGEKHVRYLQDIGVERKADRIMMNRRRRKELYIAVSILIGIFVLGWIIAQIVG